MSFNSRNESSQNETNKKVRGSGYYLTESRRSILANIYHNNPKITKKQVIEFFGRQEPKVDLIAIKYIVDSKELEAQFWAADKKRVTEKEWAALDRQGINEIVEMYLHLEKKMTNYPNNPYKNKAKKILSVNDAKNKAMENLSSNSYGKKVDKNEDLYIYFRPKKSDRSNNWLVRIPGNGESKYFRTLKEAKEHRNKILGLATATPPSDSVQNSNSAADAQIARAGEEELLNDDLFDFIDDMDAPDFEEAPLDPFSPSTGEFYLNFADDILDDLPDVSPIRELPNAFVGSMGWLRL